MSNLLDHSLPVWVNVWLTHTTNHKKVTPGSPLSNFEHEVH